MQTVIIPVKEYQLMQQIYDNIVNAGKMNLPHYRHAQRKYYIDNRDKILEKMKRERDSVRPRRTMVIRLDDTSPKLPQMEVAALARY